MVSNCPGVYRTQIKPSFPRTRESMPRSAAIHGSPLSRGRRFHRGTPLARHPGESRDPGNETTAAWTLDAGFRRHDNQWPDQRLQGSMLWPSPLPQPGHHESPITSAERREVTSHRRHRRLLRHPGESRDPVPSASRRSGISDSKPPSPTFLTDDFDEFDIGATAGDGSDRRLGYDPFAAWRMADLPPSP